MNSNSNNRLSILLISGSLLLLFCFVYLWLRQVYGNEYDALKKETDLAFLQTVRDLENDYLLKMDPLSEEEMDSPDSNRQKKVERRMLNIIDTVRTLSANKTAVFSMVLSDSNGSSVWNDMPVDTVEIIAMTNQAELPVRMESKSVSHPTTHLKIKTGISANQLQGPLSLLVAMKGSATGLPGPDTIDISPLLADRFQKITASTKLPASFEIIRFEDTSPLSNPFRSDSYLDIWSGYHYAAALPDFNRHLWQRMLPSVLFSLLLLASVSAAFFVIYRNLLQQRRLTALKNDFISNMTHELKTPITTVGVAIEALSSFDALKNPERTQEYLQISKNELDRLGILVDKVMKMSLFEQDHPALKYEEIDLKILVQDVLNSMKLQFEKLLAKVQFRFTGTDFLIRADRLHLTSVIYNLLDNALKYSPDQPEIFISLSSENNRLRIAVQDQGMGIGKEFQGQIFNKFFRVPAGNAHNVKGHGLGLNYVASVIRQHQGEISVDSEPGKGSCFTILLPQQPLDKNDQQA